MQLILWTFQGLQIPMIKDESGTLYCTSRKLCTVLGLTDTQLRMVLTRNRSRLNPICVTDCDANLQQFIRSNRTELELGYIRGDMLIWPLREALGVAFHVHTDVAWEFHQASIDLVIEHSRIQTISQEQYDLLCARLRALEEAHAEARPALESAASAAGAALSAQRGTKPLRLLN